MADDVRNAPEAIAAGATASAASCPYCHGTGYITEYVTERCYCGGGKACPTCGGSGTYQKAVKRICYH
jgi:DnaJ-class molecular chaperone